MNDLQVKKTDTELQNEFEKKFSVAKQMARVINSLFAEDVQFKQKMTFANQEPHLEKILQIPPAETSDVSTMMGVFVGYKITELGMKEEYLEKSAAARDGLQDITLFLTADGKITRAEKIHIIEKHTDSYLVQKYREYLIDNAFYSKNVQTSDDGKLIYTLYIYDQGKRLREWLRLVEKLSELAKTSSAGFVLWTPPEMPPLFELRLKNLLYMFFDLIETTDDGSWRLHLKGHKPAKASGGIILTDIFSKSE